MAFLIRNIIEFNLLDGVKIVAGEKGNDNEILWVNLMEILDALDSLQKGELLVTTGYNMDNEDQYKDIILRLKNRGLCGMAIQPGYYIDEIPKYIKDSANKYDFPIIELPSNLTFSHIMHVLLDNINLRSNVNNDSNFVNLKNKLTHIINSGTDNYISKMMELKSECKLYLFLVSVHYMDNSEYQNDILLKGIDKIKSYFMSKSEEVEMEWFGEKVLFIVLLKKELPFQDINFGISKILNSISDELKINFFIGVSELRDINHILDTFDNAMIGQQTLNNIGANKGICAFEDIKLFKLFEIMHYSNYSVEFSQNILKPIIDYDKVHKSSHLETLKLYLVNECNITNTANKLFIHRHTLKNRLNKISKLCNVDFENYYSRISFSMAIFIHDYFIS
ncbi:PucR family transcriptional regulator [Clostridium tyrobutyricum]|uniref:PucR family transcriptional regulator n=1 Tax=Clostridium tyrobutyricum TaxID=1519 RepID=UPI0002EA5DB4|nr:PucR family transcriptional regulator ligand-binding domain-containing protein [Clostridium tyrobutyricum]MBV4424949.1 PucR family transcriptional regulator ligand-binding domain-containing protein [Clostridium tyrobutyricum]MBV4427218.1 PucR family transcriptional regulator ligand-binding domain-containing protein [Clostridium tyrobutyricum]MBV4442447.1 PucR family transcriptional regulator ligand-binding domain-containing protein [Clostridium tyrobutyricum]MEA5008876.1 PucR family transcri